jgi:methyl-accepting chemotaxis protein
VRAAFCPAGARTIDPLPENSMTLRTQVAIGFSLLFAVCLVAFTSLYWSIDRVKGAVEEVTENRYPKVVAAFEIIDLVSRNYTATANLIGLGSGKPDDAFRAEMKLVSEQITERFKQLEATVRSARGKELIGNALGARKQYTSSRATALELAARGELDAARKHLGADTNAARIRYQEALGAFISFQSTNTREAAAAAASTHRNAAITAIASALLVALAIVGLFLFLLRTLRRLLGGEPAAARRIAAEIAAGRLDCPIEVRAGDRDSVIASLSAMRDALRKLVAEIGAGAQAVRASAQEALGTSGRLAGLVAHQSDETSAAAATIEELTVSVGQIADSARAAESAAVEARKTAESGARAIADGLGRINQIAESVRNAEAAMSELGVKAREISTVVRVISEIAEQTNLLALNAAIEAARAGEAGRGFAVVADEVRGLAERTSISTAEITRVVDSIQSVAADTQSKMGAVATQVRGQEQVSAEVSEAIGGISAAAARVSTAVTEMSGSLEEQTQASNGIARKVEEIARMNESSDATAREVSALARALDELSGRLAQTSAAFRV